MEGIMQLFIGGAFASYSTLEIVTFILAIVFVAVAVSFIFLTFKNSMGKVFKIFSHLIMPVLAVTFLFALMFLRLNVFSAIVSFVVAFGIAVCCELIAFGVAYLIAKRKGIEE